MTPRSYHHPDTTELSLAHILSALSDPTRLEVVRRLTNGLEHDSLDLAEYLPLSTLTYHTRMLGEAGLTWTRSEVRACLIRLRRDDIDGLFPGILDAVITSAGRTEQAP